MSGANCPKRTGFNTLLFDAALQDSCTDKNCYNNKLTKNVERQVAEKPQLVQITNEWRTPGSSAVLGRNQYVALNLTAKSAKSKKPLSPYQKPCKTHERGPCGRRHRAWANCESLCRAELPRTLR